MHYNYIVQGGYVMASRYKMMTIVAVLSVLISSAIYYWTNRETEIVLNISEVYLGDNSISVQTESGVYQYPVSSVPIVQSDTSISYISRDTRSKRLDTIYLSKERLDELANLYENGGTNIKISPSVQ